MKGLICYFSTTGNTRLACQYIAKSIKNVDFELYDITKDTLPEMTSYSVIGFATFTASLRPPILMQEFIKQFPQQRQTAVFIFNTYANFSGQTLKIMKDLVMQKGFTFIAGHSLRTPENYPPYLAKGITRSNAPNHKELGQFKSFIVILDKMLANFAMGTSIPQIKLKNSWINSLISMLPRKSSQKKMGQIFTDAELCNECGDCKKNCPYQAIELNPKPVFNYAKCYGCWSCYNHCPTQAIYTKNLKGIGHYPKSNELFQAKLLPMNCQIKSEILSSEKLSTNKLNHNRLEAGGLFGRLKSTKEPGGKPEATVIESIRLKPRV